MEVKINTKNILLELLANLEAVDEKELTDFSEAIINSKHIFLAGSGRSGLAIRAFANRLMHLGLKVSVIGDLTTSYAVNGDLLIIGSGSGETQSLVAIAQKAKRDGVKIALNTISSESTIAKLADVKFILPGASPKVKDGKSMGISIQPMGSSYEQLSFIIYDAIIMNLMNKIGENVDTMFARHANLE